LPVVQLKAPERADHLRAGLRFADLAQIKLDAELRASQYDRNLFSDLDDGDNDGLFWRSQASRHWGESDSLMYRIRDRGRDYLARERLFPAELNRDYLLPQDTSAGQSLSLQELIGALQPHRLHGIDFDLAWLEYSDGFQSEAYRATLTSEWHNRLTTAVTGRLASSNLSTTLPGSEGEIKSFEARSEYEIQPRIRLRSEYEHDYRRRDYDHGGGAEYDRVAIRLTGPFESIGYERFDEDSLNTGATKYVKRDRLTVSSRRTIAGISYTADITRQWIEDERLKEDQLLSRLGYVYRNRGARLEIGGAYAVSNETRNARGITYLEVEPGEGDFILVDGAYVPDPDGDYLQLEEILSDEASVRRGEKSFRLSRSWPGATVRFDASIEEELKEGGERTWLWAVPFLSDDAQPYLYYLRTYRGEVGLIALDGGHAVKFNYSENLQMREVAAANRRRLNRELLTTFRQRAGSLRFEQRLRLFSSDRDDYFSGAGEIEGYKASLLMRRLISASEISLGASRRDASSAVGERSDTWAVELSTRLQATRQGEFRGALELYRQRLSGVQGTPSYSLTDNRSGELGAIWSVSARYGVPSGIRLNLSVNGRHSDDRTGRVTARGELVAGF
jgi:hypothetical protein